MEQVSHRAFSVVQKSAFSVLVQYHEMHLCQVSGFTSNTKTSVPKPHLSSDEELEDNVIMVKELVSNYLLLYCNCSYSFEKYKYYIQFDPHLKNSRVTFLIFNMCDQSN